MEQEKMRASSLPLSCWAASGAVVFVFMLLALSGCGDRPGGGPTDVTERAGALKSGDPVDVLQVRRVRRDAGELAVRAAHLASLVTGKSCLESDAAGWARNAVEEGYAADQPFQCSSALRISYESGRDVLIAKEIRGVLSQLEIQESAASYGALGSKISKSEAVALAEKFVLDEGSDPIFAAPEMVWEPVHVRAYVDGFSGGDGTASAIRDFGVLFKRKRKGMFVLDTLLEVRVDAGDGQTVAVILSDVSVSEVGSDALSIGEVDASVELDAQLQALAPGMSASGFSVREVSTGYILDEDQDDAELLPSSWAL